MPQIDWVINSQYLKPISSCELNWIPTFTPLLKQLFNSCRDDISKQFDVVRLPYSDDGKISNPSQGYVAKLYRLYIVNASYIYDTWNRLVHTFHSFVSIYVSVTLIRWISLGENNQIACINGLNLLWNISYKSDVILVWTHSSPSAMTTIFCVHAFKTFVSHLRNRTKLEDMPRIPLFRWILLLFLSVWLMHITLAWYTYLWSAFIFWFVIEDSY